MRRTVLLLALLAGCSKEESASVGAAPADPNAPEKIKLISKGKRYSNPEFLVPGYVTILEFYADW